MEVKKSAPDPATIDEELFEKVLPELASGDDEPASPVEADYEDDVESD